MGDHLTPDGKYKSDKFLTYRFQTETYGIFRIEPPVEDVLSLVLTRGRAERICARIFALLTRARDKEHSDDLEIATAGYEQHARSETDG